MGGDTEKEKTNRSTIRTINVNKLSTHQLDPNAVGLQCSVYASIINGKYKSRSIRTLLDTGAIFSVIHVSLLKELANEGFDYKISRTTRSIPYSASNDSLQVLGDVILNLQFVPGEKEGPLKLKKIRCTVLKELSCPLIIGMEVLGLSKLKIEKTFIEMFYRRVPLCDAENDLHMEVIDSSVIEDRDLTIVSLKKQNAFFPAYVPHGNYVLSVFIPDFTSNVSVDSEILASEPRFVNSSELQGPIDIQFNRKLYEVPKVIRAQLSELLDTDAESKS